MIELKGRLTYHNPDGTFGLVGVDITKIEDPKIYAAICKLKDYEDLGFHPNGMEIIIRLYDELVKKVDELEKKLDQCEKE